MLANFLNKSKPINFIGLLAFFFLNYLASFFLTDTTNPINLVFFYEELLKILLFLIVFFFLNFIISKNDLTFDNSYGFFVFVILAVCLLQLMINLDNLVIVALQVLFFRKVYSLHSTNQLLQKLFDAGFWLGLLWIFDSNSSFYFVLLFASLLLHQKLTLQTLFAPLVGALTPLFLYFSYLFWHDRHEELQGLMTISIQKKGALLFSSKNHLFFMTILGLTGAAALLKSIRVLPISNTFRKSWLVVLIHFALALSLIYFYPSENSNPMIQLLFPVTVILANGIELLKKVLFKEILIYSLLLASLLFLYLL